MIDIVELLAQPLRYPFMVRGLLASLMVGTLCAVVGSYVVLRGMAFFGDAVAHAILPGIAVAYLMEINLFWGALAMGLLTAVGIGYLSRRGQVKEDTAIGVIFAASFALGVALLSTVQTYSVDLTHILFGNILGVTPVDLWIMLGVAVVVVVTVVAFYKELLVTSFDPGHAVATGLSPDLVRYGLLLLLALTIVSAIQAVGVVMVVALLVTPAATASLLTRRLPRIIALGAVFAVLAARGGLYASFYANAASGATIVLMLTGLFVLTFLLAPGRGLLWRTLSRT